MNLHHLLQQRENDRKPLRVALIGAGKFGSMYLAQARSTPGMHVVAVADLHPDRARSSLLATGWAIERIGAATLADAARDRTTHLTDDVERVIASPQVDIIVDATGSPSAGIRHVLACCAHGKSIVMVNVEADALAGPLLARTAQQAGIVYSLAYGDQPALVCELVDWARAAGFEVVAAGKGTKYLPAYHASTPQTVWSHYGLTEDDARAGGLNAQMFNSFLDGTKSAIEMAAVANATGLLPAPTGSRSRPAASTTCRAYCDRARMVERSTTPARWRSCRASSATESRCSATCAGACTSRFVAKARTWSAASASTVCSPTTAAVTRRCTSRIT